jgi:DNA polymerase III subunit epsilon
MVYIKSSYAALQAVMNQNNYVVLDTETTGINNSAQIVQLAILAHDGTVVMDTLLKPTIPIPPDATAIHRISNADVQHAPTMAEASVQERFISAIQGRDVIIYNADYDLRLLRQSLAAYGDQLSWESSAQSWACAMLAYAEFRGEQGRRPGEWRWHSLGKACSQQKIVVENAHNALGDCQMTLALLKKFAGQP